jgi:peptidoglycan/xylan/chitin deacetylase (PgdA/CDA1 family)
MSLPIASLSLDLDNEWSYLKTHGDPGWEGFPSYLEVVVPRFLAMFRELQLWATVFVVGQDAALTPNEAALRAIAEAGHEIGNHSFHHEPWLHRYTEEQFDDELALSEQHLRRVTGQQPVGFRGPGYSLSPTTLEILARRGYRYDASTLPTFLGPAARAYYFLTARLSRGQKQERKLLFGRLRDGFRPLRPYWWNTAHGRILEIPVTTIPWIKTPFHVSYLLYLRQFSHALARRYFRVALRLCRLSGVAPSLLLHPLDFLGRDDCPDLAFFPAMRLPSPPKVAFVREVLEDYARAFRVVSMGEHAAYVQEQPADLQARGVEACTC